MNACNRKSIDKKLFSPEKKIRSDKRNFVLNKQSANSAKTYRISWNDGASRLEGKLVDKRKYLFAYSSGIFNPVSQLEFDTVSVNKIN